MRRFLATLALACAAYLFAAAPAGANFGLKELGVTFTSGANPAYQAGGHPFELRTDLASITHPEPALPEFGELVDGDVKDLTISMPPGIAAALTAIPHCSNADFLAFNGPLCAPGSAIGSATVTAGDPGSTSTAPVYILDPPPGVVMKIGFQVLGVVLVTAEVAVNPTPPYNAVVRVTNVPNLAQFYSSHVTLWGVPADPAHDAERGGPAEAPEVAFLTSPRACEGTLSAHFEALAWQGDLFGQDVALSDDSETPAELGFRECGRLGFAPRSEARPTTDRAESPSGLDFELEIEDESLANPAGIADSDIKKATVTLPEGMTLNPSVAEGLVACSPPQFAAESLGSAPGEGCPQASKVGTVEAETPLLGGRVLKGGLFVATQNDNPFGSLIALYMVIREPELGLIFKLAGRVSPNPHTGQIETTFGEPGQEIPQYPLDSVRIHLREGGHSPLITPPACAPYKTTATFTPWADPDRPFVNESSFEITSGVDGGPCPPPGALPFEPGFQAGTLNNDAGSYSPFYAHLLRRDGDQDLTRLSINLPPGVLGRLAGVSQCPEAQIAAAKAQTGRAELASPSCPESSAIGRTSTGVGVGSQLAYTPGRLYLAGHYNGDPLSVVAIVPAVAGPFDVGTVVVRVALALDPRNAVVVVDGAASDPIPHILEGIVLKVREVEIYADRPDFTLNPTGCRESQSTATVFGASLDVFDPADDVGVERSARFQAANCAARGFSPRLAFSLKGGTRRGAHPAFSAVITPRPGDANFSRAVVTLPRSAFLEQGHIRTICTRVQFAAGEGNGAECPAGSIYGQARAWTPLLDEPAQGPVYLRSSDHNLPDLVVALKGPPQAAVRVELVGRIDSHKGGIRSTFEHIPDVPVSRFVLEMQGGAKGLIVNSRGLCTKPSKATARLSGQNGRKSNTAPRVRAKRCPHTGRHGRHRR